MSNPKLSDIPDIFAGAGALNAAWNMGSGTFGYDEVEGATYIESGVIPSYVGASLYDAVDSSFSLQVTPADGVMQQTALVIQADGNNYVQMHVGPSNQFRGFVAINKEVFLPAESFPEYDPVAHAFWRLRDEEGKTFFFDVSGDGNSWTEIGSIGYAWDATNVSVMVFAGETEEEGEHKRSYITHVNLRPSQFVLFATGDGLSGGDGTPHDTSPWLLGGVGAGVSGGGNLTLTIGIVRGGITDIGIWDSLQEDAAMSRVVGGASKTINASTVGRPWVSASAPGEYRDGSYWPSARYASVATTWANIPDTNYQYLTNVQFEQNNNVGNRLGLDAASYQTRCMYAPQSSAGQGGSGKVIRTPVRAYSGKYSGFMTFYGDTTSPRNLPSGLNVYFPYPSFEAQAPVIQGEILRGSVYLSGDRVGLQWFPAIIQYKDDGTIAKASYLDVSIPNVMTHPGSGAWQQGSFTTPVVSGATRAAVIPVVVWSGIAEVETVYMDNHFLTGITPSVSNAPSPFDSPRNLNINVKADKVNYVMNSGFNADTYGWGIYSAGVSGGSISNVMTMAWDSGVGHKSLGSARLDVTVPSGGTTLAPGAKIGLGSQRLFSGSTPPQVQNLQAGETYNFSVWVKKGVGCPDIKMSFYDANGYGLINGLNYNSTANGSQPQNVDGSWVRLEQWYTVPDYGLPDMHLWIWVSGDDIPTTAPFSYWVDSVMVTVGKEPQDYFDGNYGSADYLWEGTANRSRTHYYKDLLNKRARVNSIVKANSPLGSNYNIKYAQAPN